MESFFKQANLWKRMVIFTVGLLVMSFGIVLLIQANLGSAPWDVLNIGLFNQLGLTIGSWTIIVGFFVLFLSAILSKTIPQLGALLNMFLVGLFIDLFLLIPFLETPSSVIGREGMFLLGLVIMGYGMGLYISANLGAGPRDSLMIVLANKLRWSIPSTRLMMEAFVLTIGWILGGPVFWGTVVYALLIGRIAGWSIPQCEKLTTYFLEKKWRKTESIEGNINNREANL